MERTNAGLKELIQGWGYRGYHCYQMPIGSLERGSWRVSAHPSCWCIWRSRTNRKVQQGRPISMNPLIGSRASRHMPRARFRETPRSVTGKHPTASIPHASPRTLLPQASRVRPIAIGTRPTVPTGTRSHPTWRVRRPSVRDVGPALCHRSRPRRRTHLSSSAGCTSDTFGSPPRIEPDQRNSSVADSRWSTFRTVRGLDYGVPTGSTLNERNCRRISTMSTSHGCPGRRHRQPDGTGSALPVVADHFAAVFPSHGAPVGSRGLFQRARQMSPVPDIQRRVRGRRSP